MNKRRRWKAKRRRRAAGAIGDFARTVAGLFRTPMAIHQGPGGGVVITPATPLGALLDAARRHDLKERE